MNWTLTDGRPIWQQLVDGLTLAIAKGDYPQGGRIPPVRELAMEAGVNPNTMQRALAQLEGDGLIVTNRTAGRTVTEDGERIHTLCCALATEASTQYLNQMAALGFQPRDAAQFLMEREEHP